MGTWWKDDYQGKDKGIRKKNLTAVPLCLTYNLIGRHSEFNPDHRYEKPLTVTDTHYN
jgi:hypothetical protein